MPFFILLIGVTVMEENKVQSKDKKAKSGNIIDKLSRQLLISLLILTAAAAVRFFLPQVYERITESFSNSVDFVSAFNAIGEGISGEQDMSDAIARACRYAFIGSETDSFQVVSLD